MIYGIGIDVIQPHRVARLLDKYGERFVSRVLTPLEQPRYARTKQQVLFLANRFAAKEAFSKAMGTGIHFPVNWHNVSVANERSGRPYLEFSEPLAALLRQRGISRAHLSLSDEVEMACAFVVLEGNDHE